MLHSNHFRRTYAAGQCHCAVCLILSRRLALHIMQGFLLSMHCTYICKLSTVESCASSLYHSYLGILFFFLACGFICTGEMISSCIHTYVYIVLTVRRHGTCIGHSVHTWLHFMVIYCGRNFNPAHFPLFLISTWTPGGTIPYWV